MSGWTEQQLAVIERTDELEVAPRRGDGSLAGKRIVWAVRVGDDVYIRSVRGRSGAWYRTTRSSHAGHLSADTDGVDTDVTFADIDATAPVGDQIDAAYRAKYSRYPGPVKSITADEARATTLKLSPK
ncbi:DUF2255 family protein [Actinospica durhamensis]|uniref:DUF2255 family protein n=1 Tax=Actinospica durhamensis TaxID=1508375 RepID=A0A941EVK4_9ACTN|nr:DUF2255 family protein [Actinospica durhamensis]MBR7838058.1 DUF2255 family protein [Actinospica durhamensis]